MLFTVSTNSFSSYQSASSLAALLPATAAAPVQLTGTPISDLTGLFERDLVGCGLVERGLYGHIDGMSMDCFGGYTVVDFSKACAAYTLAAHAITTAPMTADAITAHTDLSDEQIVDRRNDLGNAQKLYLGLEAIESNLEAIESGSGSGSGRPVNYQNIWQPVPVINNQTRLTCRWKTH